MDAPPNLSLSETYRLFDNDSLQRFVEAAGEHLKRTDLHVCDRAILLASMANAVGLYTEIERYYALACQEYRLVCALGNASTDVVISRFRMQTLLADARELLAEGPEPGVDYNVVGDEGGEVDADGCRTILPSIETDDDGPDGVNLPPDHPDHEVNIDRRAEVEDETEHVSSTWVQRAFDRPGTI